MRFPDRQSSGMAARSRRIAGALFPRCWLVLVLAVAFASSCWAQFSSSLQGTVTDPSGAVIGNATVTLTNPDTNQQKSTTTTGSGTYRFDSLAPGNYQIQVTAAGFTATQVATRLTTEQTAGVDVKLNVGNETTQVQVSAQGPALNPEENRVETTLDTEQVRTLPLQNRGTLNLVNAAPGVSGYSQNLDNFQNEETPNANANGHFSGSNLYVIDGIESDSNITGGTNNITPNPDSLQEIALQTNTFAVDFYGGAGVTTEMTTKAGSNKFHGTGEISFYNQDLEARTFFSGPGGNQPYKRFEYSGTLGGPIYKDKTFFFASVEKLASTVPAGTNFFANEDPALVALAQRNFPNTIGTRTLTQYPAQGINVQSVRFYTSPDLVTQCATPTGNCTIPFIDNVNQTTAPFNNGLQYSLRLDQNFRDGKDRIYAYYFHIDHQVQAIDPRPAFDSTTNTISALYSINYTHVFTPSILNEFSFGYKRVFGDRNAPQPTVPELALNNTYGIGANGNPAFGGGFGPGAFAQHSYNWRDVVTYVRGRHDIRIGFQASHSNDSADFAGSYARPTFSFNNGLADFVQDKVYQENGISYSPATGQVSPFQFGAQVNNYGAYVQDSWKILPNLTVQLGIRWDDFSNPSPFLYAAFPVLANVIPVNSTKLLGSNAAIDAQFANASVRTGNNIYNGSLNNNWAPRVGFSYAPTKNRLSTVHGGVGLYYEQISLGQVLDQLRGNPPGQFTPTFGQNTGNPVAPIDSFGTSGVYPYGFPLPAFQAGKLDARGGIPGTAAPVQGLDPNVRTPPTLNYTLGVSQQFAYNAVATITYTGSYSWDQLTASDFNRSAGDLIRNAGVPQRLNPSFGSIIYAGNFSSNRYDSVIFALQQRIKSLDYQDSYTWSHALGYGTCDTRYTFNNNLDCPPDQHALGTGYYGNSSFDEPNDFKLSGSYTLPSPKLRYIKEAAGGWQVTTLFVAQSGTPYTVENYSAWGGGANDGGKIVNGQFTTVTAGDYNADGTGQDYPNVDRNIRRSFTHKQLTQPGGIFGRKVTQDSTNGDPIGFTAPLPGTQGNEARNSFRNPGLFEWDASVLKNTALPWFQGEKSNLQLRVDGFNVINHTNFGTGNTGANVIDNNLASGTFGQATSSLQPRIIQLGARFEF